MDNLSTLNNYCPPTPTFASGATITNFASNSSGSGVSNFTDGIPSDYDITSSPNKRVLIADFNGIGELATRDKFFRQCGGYYTFDSILSGYIGGYPKGIRLGYWDGTYYRNVISLIDNNTYNFVSTPSYIDNTHWSYCDNTSQRQLCIYPDVSTLVKKAWWNRTSGETTMSFYADDDCYFFPSISVHPNNTKSYTVKIYTSYGTKERIYVDNKSFYDERIAYCFTLLLRKGTTFHVYIGGGNSLNNWGDYVYSKLTTGDWS